MKTKPHDNIIPYLYEGVYVVDRKRKITFWNEGSERITGYSAAEVTDSFCYQNILQHIDDNGKQLCIEGCPLQKTLEDGLMNEANVYLKHKDGYRIPVMVKTLPVYDDNNTIVAAIEVFTDERFQQKVYEENVALKDKLKTDPLTKVANRHFFDFELSKRMEEAIQFNQTFGIIIADIDHFKKINDTYGHLVGDEMLKIVAHSLTSNIDKNDLISRWGGEEFIGIVDVDTIEALKTVAERLRNVIQASSYQTKQGETIRVTVSIGGCLFEQEDTKSLLEKADRNMYIAKQNGRNQSCIE